MTEFAWKKSSFFIRNAYKEAGRWGTSNALNLGFSTLEGIQYFSLKEIHIFINQNLKMKKAAIEFYFFRSAIVFQLQHLIISCKTKNPN